MHPLPLHGLRILVVEDDPIIALDLPEVLRAAGAEVVGPAHTVAKALRLIETQPVDAAVLDHRLEDHTAIPVGERLLRDGVPFLFHTSSRGGPELAFPTVRILDKPTHPEQLVAEIKALTGSR
jgi:DNA-binding response OmpR family regulator